MKIEKKIDWIFAESKDEHDFPGFNEKGNKLDGIFKKGKTDGPESEIYDKFGTKAFYKFKKADTSSSSEELYNKNGKQLDGA